MEYSIESLSCNIDVLLTALNAKEMNLRIFCCSLLLYTLVVAPVGSSEPYGNIVVNVKAVYDLNEQPTNCGTWKNNFEKIIQGVNFLIGENTAIKHEGNARDHYLCVKKVNVYVPSFWDLDCAPEISRTTIKDDPDVLIAPMATSTLFARTPSYCDTNSKVAIFPFKDIYSAENGVFLEIQLLTVKYAPLTYSDKSNLDAPIERKIDCNTNTTQFNLLEYIKEDISKKKNELTRLDNCDPYAIDFQYFYYQEDTEKLSTIPEVKVTNDGIDAAISITYGGKELDGVSVNLKVQGAEEENVEMENEGGVYKVQVTGLTPGKYDLEFVITGQEAKVKGDFEKVKCCKGYVYGSDGVSYFGNFDHTVSKSVQVGSSDRTLSTVTICLIAAACLAGLVVVGAIVKYSMDKNKSKKKKRKSKEDLEEDEDSAEDANTEDNDEDRSDNN